jgi:(p)ppGpp synthase/HD superfamily hydrolase
VKLEEAISVAAKAHMGQTDQQGQPYIRHCLRVMEALAPDVEAMVVGVLHDIVEDTETALDYFGGSALEYAQFHALRLLTRESDQTYEDYIARMIEPGPPQALACKVKLADLEDNLGRINGLREPKRTLLVARYEAAHDILLRRLGRRAA